ncbi:hypothetical protein Noda2021_06150 [Candidatus Dependentiae bacterium Noda2021]|nr:hypothetical protein Noda2021_06150 [Candidatus Dependentiae bacterium Noda2021]
MKKIINYALLLSLVILSPSVCSELPHDKKRAAHDDLNNGPTKKYKIPGDQDLEFTSFAENLFDTMLATHSRTCINNDVADLVEAIKTDQFDVAKRLIEKGIDLKQKDNEFSILALAIQCNDDNSHDEIINLLIDNGATIAYHSLIERSALPLAPLEAAINHHQNRLAKRLIGHYDIPLSERTLFAAFQSGNQEMALIILLDLKHLRYPINATYNTEKLRRAVGNFIPSWVVEKKVFDAYKIKQMIRAKEIELLEIE